MIAAALVAGVFVLYVATYASIPMGDGYWFLDIIVRADRELLFNPPSLLTQLGFFGLKRLTDLFGLSIAPLKVIQTVNALAAGSGAALLYGIARVVGGSRLLSAFIGILLAVSFAYWHFANDDRQLISLVVLLLIFWLIVRARVRGAWGWPFVAGVGLLNALAVLLRQENALFGLAAVVLLCFGRPWRSAGRDAILYAVIGTVGTWMVAILFALAFVPDVHTFRDAVYWYLWIFHEHIGQPLDFQGFEYATKFDVPRVIKGQLTAFVVGTQAIVDAIRDRALLSRPKVIGLVALTTAAYGIMAILAAGLSRRRRLVETRLVVVAGGCALWLLSYSLIFHAWLWPTVTKYYVVTLPPLIVLLVLSAIGAQKSDDDKHRTLQVGLIGVLVAVVFVVNLWGDILPRLRYTEMKAELEARRAADFRAEDLFVSSESGIDTIFARLYQGGGAHHVSVKNVFVKKPAPEAFAAIRVEIERQLALGRRVFVYNFVPAPYSLIAINQSPVRGGTPLSAREFETCLDELRKTYAMRPLFTYWEESKAPLYLFGERLEPFFELRRRS